MDTKEAQNQIRQNIITMFEINKLPEDKQEETLSRIARIILQATLTRILPLLEEAELNEYEKLMESGADPDKVLDFFFDKIPNFLDIIAEETENFRKESAEVLSQV